MGNPQNQDAAMDLSRRELPVVEKSGATEGEPESILTSSGWGGGSADTIKKGADLVKTKTLARPEK